MKKWFLQTLALAAVATAGQAYASSCDCAPAPKCEPCTPAPKCECECPDDFNYQPAYNASARIAVDGCWDAFITASFIYWTPREKGLEVAYTHDVDQPTGFSVHDVGTTYKPGFEVGLGFNVDHDQWVPSLNYTRLHLTEKAHTGTVDPVVTVLDPAWLASGNDAGEDNFTSGHSKWTMNMDLIDLQIARPFYLGKYLTISPVAALRGGWIHQKYHATYNTDATVPASVVSSSSEKTWLIGPRAGLESQWLLGMGFRFYGDIFTGLFYQKFRVHASQDDATDTTETYASSHREFGLATPYLDFNLGLGYGDYFGCGCNKTWHFDLAVGYQFQIWWDQNYMRELNNNFDSISTGDAASLILHGLTITARVDF